MKHSKLSFLSICVCILSTSNRMFAWSCFSYTVLINEAINEQGEYLKFNKFVNESWYTVILLALDATLYV
jgi:hypothetical protein